MVLAPRCARLKRQADVRLVLGLIVFALDMYALAGLFGSQLRRSRKLAWTATILFIPFAGAILWLRSGHASKGRR